MRVLVTGGAGFIGSHVADALVAHGHDAVLLDALLPQAHGEPPNRHGGRPPKANGDGLPNANGDGRANGYGGEPPNWIEGHEFVRGDVRDAGLLRTLMPGVDAVCHQAAMVGHGVDPSDAPDYAAHNDLGTAILLAEMHRAGVRRLVLAGSMVVYGEGRYDCPAHGTVRPAPRVQADLDVGRFDPSCPSCGRALTPGLVCEDAPLDPRSTYAATKLAQEHLASAWARQTGGSVWSLRYHNVYGPRMPFGTPYAGVASIFRSALQRGDAPQVLEDGRQRRDFVHVTDVARANLLALEQPAEGFVAANVCSGEPHTVGELAAELARAMAGPEPQVVGGARPGDVRHVVADPAFARERLGFRATVGFGTGVARFATDPMRSSGAESLDRWAS